MILVSNKKCGAHVEQICLQNKIAHDALCRNASCNTISKDFLVLIMVAALPEERVACLLQLAHSLLLMCISISFLQCIWLQRVLFAALTKTTNAWCHVQLCIYLSQLDLSWSPSVLNIQPVSIQRVECYIKIITHKGQLQAEG